MRNKQKISNIGAAEKVLHASPTSTTSNVVGPNSILTISTASITELQSIDVDTDLLKSQQDNKKLLHCTKNEQQQHQSSATHATCTLPGTTSTTPSAIATVKQKFCGLCNFEKYVSFQNNTVGLHQRRGRRLHGLQLPLHPLQLCGWLMLLLFGLTTYTVLIPSFVVALQGPLYGLLTGLYIVHIVSHLTALLTDPADKELRRIHRNDRIVPEFDRSKHTHVIENGRCHLCNIPTSSPRTKHCSVCNKCVGKFDHHCKWLNHCIGSRNYVAFLMCLVSAVIATLVIVAAVIAQIAFYYVQPAWLSCYWCNAIGLTTGTNFQLDLAKNVYFNESGYTSNDTLRLLESDFANIENSSTIGGLINNLTLLVTDKEEEFKNLTTEPIIDLEIEATSTAATHFERNVTSDTSTSASTVAGIDRSETIYLILISIFGLLVAITAGLLLHLCFFHVYISFLGVTTYEYIRNHRQSQEAKAKELKNTNMNANSSSTITAAATTTATTTTLPKNGTVHFSANLIKKRRNNNECGHIFCCSNLEHPKHYFETNSNAVQKKNAAVDDDEDENESDEKSCRLRLHCCANSREYNQHAATKTYYMCSLLDERTSTSNPITMSELAQLSNVVTPYESNNLNAREPEVLTNFHCCSSFTATTAHRRVSTINATTLISDLDARANAKRSYMQYTEQCAFCTFRMPKVIGKKRTNAKNSGSSIGRPVKKVKSANQLNARQSAGSTANVHLINMKHQHCCMKSITKPQRWQRKWNCCTSVPDSPDVPNDLITTLAIRQQNLKATEFPVKIGVEHANGLNSSSTSSPPPTLNSHQTTTTRTWPMNRFQQMMRILSRYRRPRCRHRQSATGGTLVADQIRQNKISPLQLEINSNQQQQQQHQTCYNNSNSSPQLKSKNLVLELSNELNACKDFNFVAAKRMESNASVIETILPTSVIRDDTLMLPTTTLTLPPALPPPTRRRILNPIDLEEQLTESFGFVTHPSIGSGSGSGNDGKCVPTSVPQRLISNQSNQSVSRRHRRKHFLRTCSPMLSPIHESGLSNPTSPLTRRHNNNDRPAINDSNSSSPIVLRATKVVDTKTIEGLLKPISSNTT